MCAHLHKYHYIKGKLLPRYDFLINTTRIGMANKAKEAFCLDPNKSKLRE